MHCAICDKDSDSVGLHNPCSECEEAIQDCLDGYPKDEETSELPLLDEGWDSLDL